MVKKISIRLIIAIIAIIAFYSGFWFFKASSLKTNILKLANTSSYHVSVKDVNVSGFPLENKITIKDFSFMIPGNLIAGEFNIDMIELHSGLFKKDFSLQNIGNVVFKHSNGTLSTIKFNKKPNIQISFIDEIATKIDYNDSGIKISSPIENQEAFEIESSSLSLTLKNDANRNIVTNVNGNFKGLTSINFLEIYKNSLEPKIIESFENGDFKVSKTVFDDIIDEADLIKTDENANDDMLLAENLADSLAQVSKEQLADLVGDEINNLPVDEIAKDDSKDDLNNNDNKKESNIAESEILEQGEKEIEELAEINPENQAEELTKEISKDLASNISEDNLLKTDEDLQYIVIDEISSLSDEQLDEIASKVEDLDRVIEIDLEMFEKLNKASSDISFSLAYKLTSLNNPNNIQIKSDPTKIAPIQISYIKSLELNKFEISNEILEFSINGNLKTHADDPSFSGAINVEISDIDAVRSYFDGATKKLSEISVFNIEGSSLDPNRELDKDMYQIFLEKAQKNYKEVLDDLSKSSARLLMVEKIKEIRKDQKSEVEDENNDEDQVDDMSWLQINDPEKYKEMYEEFFGSNKINLKIHREKNLEFMINDRTIRDIINQL